MEAFGELLGAIFAGIAGAFFGFTGAWFIPRFLSPPRRFRWFTCAGIGIASGAFFFVAILTVERLVDKWTQPDCETNDLNEFPAPDHRHKIAVYNFDCGAASPFAVVVSLLQENESLKDEVAKRVYTHAGQKPIAEGAERNIEVSWTDASHVTVRARPLQGAPKTEVRDGVAVKIEALP